MRVWYYGTPSNPENKINAIENSCLFCNNVLLVPKEPRLAKAAFRKKRDNKTSLKNANALKKMWMFTDKLIIKSFFPGLIYV